MLGNKHKSLIGLLEKRQEALFRLVESLRKEIAGLPRGTVQIKMRGDRAYAYLQYRAGRKVCSEYKGPVGPHIERLKRAVKRRQCSEADLRVRSEQLKRLHRALWAMMPRQSAVRETPAETLDRGYAHAQYIRHLRRIVH